MSVALGQSVSHDSDSIFYKLVLQRRGGYCYELDLLLLDALMLLGCWPARPLPVTFKDLNQMNTVHAHICCLR
ncbi:arylamine N-acetyltransferase [Rothia dentocariosa]|uniref:arylamine N-acetyltransferase n=1 Tax=Rothia dentocariosa TaxID=2047 RepID=UPI003990C6AC